MSAWLKRFGLHLAAAVGATGIFVAAAAVGASQTRQQTASISPPRATAIALRTPGAERKPTVIATPPTAAGPTGTQADATQTEAPPAGETSAASGDAAPPNPRRTPVATRVAPERSLAGTIQAVLPDELDVLGIGGREWHVVPAPGALVRLNGKAASLDTFEAGDTVVILGQAETGQARGNRFLAHAITARRK